MTTEDIKAQLVALGLNKMTVDPELPMNRTWNVAEVALYLQTTPKEIYNKFYRKRLPGGRKVGRSLRFDPVKIKKWLAQNEVATLEELVTP